MSLLRVSNGIGHIQSSSSAWIVEIGASRANAVVFAKSTSGEARRVSSVGSCAYLREPMATMLQNRSCDCWWQRFGRATASKIGICGRYLSEKLATISFEGLEFLR